MLPSSEAFQAAIFSALCACLSLSPASAEASALIRRAYQSPEPAPQPSRDTDVLYYDALPEEAPESLFQFPYAAEPAVSSHRPAVSSFLSIQLLVVAYGPHAEEYCHRIRSFLFLDGAGLPRSILRRAGIYPVPRPPLPVLLREEQGSLWRTRADLTVSLRVSDTLIRSDPRPAVSVPPAVVVHTDQ